MIPHHLHRLLPTLVFASCLAVCNCGKTSTLTGDSAKDTVSPPTEDTPSSPSQGANWRTWGDAGQTGFVTALGPDGTVAGVLSGQTGVEYLFLAPPGSPVELWQAAPDNNRPVRIGHIGRNGSSCGTAYIYDPQFHGSVGAAVAGSTSSGFTRLLPDPITSTCRDGNSQGDYVGEWKAQGFLKTVDGGTIRLDLVRGPAQSSYVLTTPVAINSRGDVAGAIQYGESIGRGNPAPFVRWSDGGVSFLLNNLRSSVATDISDTGIVIGAGLPADSEFSTAMIWTDPLDAGIFLPLPEGLISSRALSINSHGVVVGYGLSGSFDSHGLVWFDGGVYLADEFWAPSPGWRISRLDFVNDSNRLAGEASFSETQPDGGVVMISLPMILDVDF